MALQYPFVNGHRMSFASIEAIYGGIKIVGFKAISWDDGLEVGKIFGAASNKLGRTAGKNDPTGSFEMYVEEGDLLLATLGDGYGKRAFDITCVFAETPGMTVIATNLIACRITKLSESHSEGTDALTYKFDIDIMEVRRNGRTIAGIFNTTGLSL